MHPRNQQPIPMARSQRPSAVGLWMGLLFLALLTWPVWRWLWGEWMGNDYYSHGVLMVPVSVYLAWRRLRVQPERMQAAQGGNGYGLLVFAAFLVVYLIFLYDRAYYLAAFALIGLAAGLVWSLFGAHRLRLWAFPLGNLVLMVPLPFLDRITLPLALFTGVCSGALVRFFGLDISIIGNAVTLPNAQLVIGAQCSGINSIMALTALNALAAYVLDGPWWGRLILILAAIPAAMIGNILRVANLLVVARFFGVEAAFRFYHDYSGVIYFGVALLLLVPVATALRCTKFRYEVL